MSPLATIVPPCHMAITKARVAKILIMGSKTASTFIRATFLSKLFFADFMKLSVSKSSWAKPLMTLMPDMLSWALSVRSENDSCTALNLWLMTLPK